MMKFKKGQKVRIKGTVAYLQDHKVREGSFEGIIFVVDKVLPDKFVILRGNGYGELGNGGESYGEGTICIGFKSLNKIEVC